ncbi:DUF4097 family beta strand repeat-containing protein [Helicobacter ailurogastricus]|uniref:DUF4097 domain-containing protein n=1 Tax=Helicobacter ailurogastricus TaxID=1578720 RepID=A0A0K2XFR4_9HELI|nr:DUF4097 family beta strand repeat-containing protein [Helicobacter ailurogastricus]CRF40354.1 hypothetical protein HAL011_01080 [Helicobacter ailurogastricus]CRF42188.1 hypothetical protein HAL013_03490 [Helicobacter ailurogastricus]CRF44921.1 hypothetical protein HAL09_15450 [Helicobacter ailurogastricus]
MEKTFEFKTRDLEIKFGLKMEIEVLTTEQKEPYALFKSEANEADLLIQNSEHSLYITTPDQGLDADLAEDIKGIHSIGDAFALLIKKGLQTNSKISGSAKIYLPADHLALYLSANNAKVAVDAPMQDLELKLNNGSVSVKSALKNLKAKLNSGDLFVYTPLDTCQIKANNGTLEIGARVRDLEIKTNNGNVQLNAPKESLETCQIKGNNTRLDLQTLIEDLDLSLNNGGVKLYAHDHVKSWNVQANGANITLKKNGVSVSLDDSGGLIGEGKVHLDTSGFVNVMD